ncbi:response regulator [Thalassomonas actiniarum]|uniref:Response regulator n=1 Tax=Thalassomonas actiniarum TaxID=485447 RepID=A0AAE9YV50_9GAMM|nr:response regulator [Thalassomonas actiniarum]WDE00083.1 response regulator [Thalassomonas actiniarum]
MTEKKRILVVDDEELNLSLITGILEDDYEVIALTSGEQCLEQFLSIDPDIVLLDVEMPVMDGLQVSRELQIIAQSPIVFVSAKGSLEERLAGYAAGGYDYIVKPVDGYELLAKIKLILEHQAEKKALEQTAQETTSAFMNALSFSSEFGYVVDFALEIYNAKSYSQVAETMLRTLGLFNVDAAVHIRADYGEAFYSNRGQCSPMEQEILILLKDRGRIYDFEQRSQINEKRVSVLVNNMPQNPEEYGRLKDHLPFMLRLTDGYLKNLDIGFQLSKQEKLLRETVQEVSEQFVVIERELKVNHSVFEAAMFDMTKDMEKSLQFLALTEEQEEQLNEIIHSHTERAFGAIDKTSMITKAFNIILTKLQKFVH